MSRIVVDTDVASYIFKGHVSVKGYVNTLRGSKLVLSFISVAEMRMGAITASWGIRRRHNLEQYLEDFEVMYADDALCTSWARLRADNRAIGRPLASEDAWIAATALALDAPLATNNLSEFENIPSLRLITPPN